MLVFKDHPPGRTFHPEVDSKLYHLFASVSSKIGGKRRVSGEKGTAIYGREGGRTALQGREKEALGWPLPCAAGPGSPGKPDFWHAWGGGALGSEP